MTRPLLLIAACGFVTTLVCFAIVAAIGPVNWRSWGDGDWGGWHDGGGWRHGGPAVYGGGPATTRELAWTPGDDLRITIPADVRYTQGPVAKMVISGPQGAVNHVIVDDEALRFDRRVRSADRLTVEITAPGIEEFTLAGSQQLSIAGFDRPRLEIQVLGSGDVVAEGRARELQIHIAGSGDVNLARVEVEDAEVNIAGSGDATLSPSGSAEVHIAGAGDVTFTRRPQNLETHIVGSGRITQPPS